MTKEQMMKRWQSTFKKMPPEINDYLEGKIDQYPEQVNLPLREFYDSDWMKEEFYGEDSETVELARRMLIVATKINKDSFAIACETITEIHFWLQIGHKFEDILEKGVRPYLLRAQLYRQYGTMKDQETPRAFGPKDSYYVAQLLFKYRPAESEAFADRLLTEKHWDNSVEFELALFMTLVLLKEDTAKYSRYLPYLTLCDNDLSGSDLERLIRLKSSAYILTAIWKNGWTEVPQPAELTPLVTHIIREIQQMAYPKGGQVPSQEQLADPTASEKLWKDWVKSFFATRSYDCSGLLDSLGLLYTYSPLAKLFVDRLLFYSRDKSYHLFYDNIWSPREKWLGEKMEQTFEVFLEGNNWYTVQTIFTRNRYEYSTDSCLQAHVQAHPEEAWACLSDEAWNGKHKRAWLQFLYTTCGWRALEPLVDLLATTKMKGLLQEIESMFEGRESEVRPLLEKRLDEMNREGAEVARRLLKQWDNAREAATETQTGPDSGPAMSPAEAVAYCQEHFDKKNKKYISWIPAEMLQGLRFADLSGPAPEVVPQYILSEYMSLGKPYRIGACDRIAAMLHPQDLEQALESIFRYWVDQTSAEAKRKMFLLPYCIYMPDSALMRLSNLMNDWAQNSRGAMASFAVNAIAINGGNMALMMIDTMAAKSRYYKIKTAAKAAFDVAAEALGVSTDALSDRIVPSLEFSTTGERTFDYGPRQFTVTLQPDFSLSIFDPEKKKTLKSLPAPGVKDDAVKAAAAKKAFSELKKQIKATVQTQTGRLEQVLRNGRKWSVAAWRELFVENVVMHAFATGLIWGVYDPRTGELQTTFRYMADGTFNTVDETEYTLPDEASITLVHPTELDPETLGRWIEQLSDYEVVQPLAQLNAPIGELAPDEIEDKRTITRYSGTVVTGSQIMSFIRKHNLQRGPVTEGGAVEYYTWIEKTLGIALQLYAKGLAAFAPAYDEEITLGEVIACRLNEKQEVIDWPSKDELVEIETLPKRFLSSVIGVLDGLRDLNKERSDD